MRLIFLGFSCNNACVFCAQGSLRRSSREPDGAALGAEIAAAARQARERGLAFVGGEPTLRPDLPALIETAKSSGAAWVLLQTNGRRLVYPGYAAALAKAGLDACEISLQGSTAAMHDYHTGVPGSWVQSVGGLRQAKACGLACSVSAVVTRSNFRHLEEISQLAQSIGAQALRLTLAASLGQALAARERVVPSPELIRPRAQAALRLCKELGLPAFFGDDGPPTLRRFFAGLGLTEPPARADAAKAAPGAPILKSRPALREVHTTRKKTGADLKALFPGLFQPGAD